MATTSILCRCGQSLRLPNRSEVVAKCPVCGRKIEYLADDLPIGTLDKRAYKRVLRHRDTGTSASTPGGEFAQFLSDLAGAFGRVALANLFWIVSGVCIAVMVGTCLYFFSLTFEPSDAELNYQMAVELRAEGRTRDASRLLEQIVAQTPRSR
jgi:hypothetical protein